MKKLIIAAVALGLTIAPAMAARDTTNYNNVVHYNNEQARNIY